MGKYSEIFWQLQEAAIPRWGKMPGNRARI